MSQDYIKECQKCQKKWYRESMGATFPYSQCQFCRVGQESHDTEKGTAWDKMDKQSSAYKQNFDRD